MIKRENPAESDPTEAKFTMAEDLELEMPQQLKEAYAMHDYFKKRDHDPDYAGYGSIALDMAQALEQNAHKGLDRGYVIRLHLKPASGPEDSSEAEDFNAWMRDRSEHLIWGDMPQATAELKDKTYALTKAEPLGHKQVRTYNIGGREQEFTEQVMVGEYLNQPVYFVETTFPDDSEGGLNAFAMTIMNEKDAIETAFPKDNQEKVVNDERLKEWHEQIIDDQPELKDEVPGPGISNQTAPARELQWVDNHKNGKIVGESLEPKDPAGRLEKEVWLLERDYKTFDPNSPDALKYKMAIDVRKTVLKIIETHDNDPEAAMKFLKLERIRSWNRADGGQMTAHLNREIEALKRVQKSKYDAEHVRVRLANPNVDPWDGELGRMRVRKSGGALLRHALNSMSTKRTRAARGPSPQKTESRSASVDKRRRNWEDV